MVNYKSFNYLPEESRHIRTVVFCDEQGFIEEFNSVDSKSIHVLIYVGETAVATGRFYSDNGDNYHVGRVAVLKEYRNKGYGKKVMLALEEEAKKIDAKKLELGAQYHATEFYEKCGYEKTDNVYFEQDCKHVMMVKTFK